MKLGQRILHEHKKSFLTFCLVGILTTTLNYLIFYILYTYASWHYLLSSATGFMSGVVLGFFLNKKYTFKSKSKKYAHQGIKYAAVNVTSLCIGLILLQLFVGLGIFVLLANALSIGVTTITNYLGSRYFSFAKRHI